MKDYFGVPLAEGDTVVFTKVERDWSPGATRGHKIAVLREGVIFGVIAAGEDTGLLDIDFEYEFGGKTSMGEHRCKPNEVIKRLWNKENEKLAGFVIDGMA